MDSDGKPGTARKGGHAVGHHRVHGDRRAIPSELGSDCDRVLPKSRPPLIGHGMGELQGCRAQREQYCADPFLFLVYGWDSYN